MIAAPFLTAEWRWLVMANWVVDPGILAGYVPAGTAIDAWNGRVYASLVAFRFLDTRVMGAPIPFHRDFDEINLRFYVRRDGEDGPRRGVVFIKEIVPKRAIAWVARVAYNENYVALPTRRRVDMAGPVREVGYGWRFEGRWHGLAAEPIGDAEPLTPDSEVEFITEHYWGYARQRDGGTKEYRVEHPSWRVWRTASSAVDFDAGALYGAAFADLSGRTPDSVFIAEGSAVAVHGGRRIPG